MIVDNANHESTKEPKYTISGDGIHPNPTGHAVIAFEILRALKVPVEVDRVEVRFAAGKAVQGKSGAFEVKKDSMRMRFFGKWPMPIDARWDQRLAEMARGYDEFNRFPVIVTGLPPGRYEIVADKVLGTATHEELAKGIDIARFKDLPLFADRDKFGSMIQDRQKKMGLAWLTEIGHQRPGTPKGAPFDKAMQADEKERSDMLEFVRSRERGKWQEFHIRKAS